MSTHGHPMDTPFISIIEYIEYNIFEVFSSESWEIRTDDGSGLWRENG